MVGVEDYAKALEDYGRRLADGLEEALPGWVESSVTRVAGAWARAGGAGATPEGLAGPARQAGLRAAGDVGPALRALLGSDVDDQRTTPLALVRAAVRYPTEVLAAAGVPPVERDDFSTSRFPDDAYDLTPASIAEVAPDLGDVALAWGAAKAWEHRRRHGGGR